MVSWARRDDRAIAWLIVNSSVIEMTSDRARQILDETRKTLARTADIAVTPRSHHYDDDTLMRWKRNMPKTQEAPRPRQPSAAEIEALRSQEWARLVDGRIELALALVLEAAGRALGMERNKQRATVLKTCALSKSDQSRAKASGTLGLLKFDASIGAISRAI